MKYLIVALLFILGMFSHGNQAQAASAPQARVHSHAVQKVQKQVAKKVRKNVQKRKWIRPPSNRTKLKVIKPAATTPKAQPQQHASKPVYTGALSPEQDAAVSWVMAETRNRIERDHAPVVMRPQVAPGRILHLADKGFAHAQHGHELGRQIVLGDRRATRDIVGRHHQLDLIVRRLREGTEGERAKGNDKKCPEAHGR